MAKIRRMFPGGNTSKGFYSLHDNIMGPDRNMLYILKGMPGGGKSSMMKEIGKRAYEKGYSVELHHCPSDASSIDAVVIEDLRIGIIDGTPPHAVDPIYPGLIDKIIDLGKFINEDVLKLYKNEIFIAKANNKSAYRKAFNYLKSSKLIYDEIESSNGLKTNYHEVNNLTKDSIEKIFSKKDDFEEYDGFKVRHLFSAAYTPEGYVDYTATILDGIKTRYYLNGSIGTGKSMFLSRVIEQARIRNYHVEVYHNPLVPSKIESVIIKELNTIISNNTETKKYIYTTIDFDEFFDLESINEEDYRVFKSLVDKGIESLGGAKDNHLALETIYKKSVDYTGITEIKDRLLREILD